MRASKEYMEKVRARILDAAGEGFREEGYGGLGINGLAKRAGLTSGAFYGHFSSKSEAFNEVITNGLKDYAQTIEKLQEDDGKRWSENFINYYLSNEHVDNLSCSCAVPGLSADVVRADEGAKKIYSVLSNQVAEKITKGIHKHDSADAWALMALLAGSVMMARSVSDPEQKKEILRAAKNWAIKIVTPE